MLIEGIDVAGTGARLDRAVVVPAGIALAVAVAWLTACAIAARSARRSPITGRSARLGERPPPGRAARALRWLSGATAVLGATGAVATPAADAAPSVRPAQPGSDPGPQRAVLPGTASVAVPSLLPGIGPAPEHSSVPGNHTAGSPAHSRSNTLPVGTSAPPPGPSLWPVGGEDPTDATAARSGRADDRVVVRRGDTLWSLARAGLGPEASDAAVMRAVTSWHRLNRTVIGSDPDVIRPGQVLQVPSSTADQPVSHRSVPHDRGPRS